jgi:diguanylate cyclase (GGDEF)-like protein/PAS domain S-box-containing protein
MPKRLKHSPFSTQWGVLGFALLILGGATGLNLWVERGRTTDREQARLLAQSRVVQENLEQNLTAVNRVLADLREEVPRYPNRGGLNVRLKTLTDAMPGIRTLNVLDAQGAVTATNRPELMDSNFAVREYFKVARQNPDPERLFVTAPFRTALGIYGINLVRIIAGPQGDFAGVISATLDPQYFKILLGSVLYAPDMWGAIAHGDGLQMLLVPEREDQVGKNLAQPGSFFTRHKESGKDTNVLTGTVYATGEERMMALRSIQPASLKQDKPLVVAVGRDLRAVYVPWRRDALVHGIFFAVVALGSTFGLYAYQRRLREFARLEAEAAQALADNEHFLNTLTDNIPSMVGYWSRDLRCRFANKAYLEWFGKTPEQMRGIRIQDLMGEELFGKNEPFIRAALRGETQRFERTLTKADGSSGYTLANYIPDLNGDGDGARGFFVLVTDVTELKRAVTALEQSEWKLKTIIETEPECVKVLAMDGTLQQINRAGLQMIEADSEAQVIGRPMTDFVVPEYRSAFVDLNERVIQGETGTLEFEIVGLKGGRRWLETHAVPMRDVNGQIAGVLGVTRDATQRKQVEQELKQLAQTDSLTHLANRRYFLALADQELSRVQRYGGTLSVLMVDIDFFKKVNDTYGHKAGDTVLQCFAGVIKEALRGVDAVGRVGGEEFAAVLPQTDSEHAVEVAQRLCNMTAALNVVLDPQRSLHFTVSIGVSTFSGTNASIETLLNHADQALYQAKSTGRNRVCVYEPPRDKSV